MEFSCKVNHESFDVPCDFLVGGEGAIPLEHRELSTVISCEGLVPEGLADLVDAFLAGAEESLHRVFGRGVEEPQGSPAATGGEAAEVGLHPRGRNETGCFDLDEAQVVEVRTRFTEGVRSDADRPTGCGCIQGPG